MKKLLILLLFLILISCKNPLGYYYIIYYKDKNIEVETFNDRFCIAKTKDKHYIKIYKKGCSEEETYPITTNTILKIKKRGY